MSRLFRVMFLSLCAFISSVTLSTASPVVQTRSSAPRISSAQLGTSATPEYKIIGEASSFSQDTPEIVAVGFVDGVNAGSVLKGLWIAEDTGEVASPNYRIAARELKLSGGGEPFSVSLSKPNNGWPIGTYRVEIYIDGTLAKVLPFTITGKAAAVTDTQVSKEGSSILGVWKGEMGQVELRKDGVLIFNGQPYRYAIQGDTLLVSSDEGSMSVPFQLNGDTLTAVVEGSKTTFTRVPSNQATTSGAGASVETRPMELVGKWCYMSNVNANDGGRKSNRCFTLNANGTYEYYAETSSSGQYGSSASQASDSGTWSVSGNTITSVSRTTVTNTYTLEKRNHPKTGDPMLVLDGDAYVTATRRPGW